MEQALQYRKASGRSMSSGLLYVVIEQAHNLPVSYYYYLFIINYNNNNNNFIPNSICGIAMEFCSVHYNLLHLITS
ncbi:unnamed protein product [Trichobilharzia regenti]|nr:unnamed protein product [Trichobilharzia regenti]